MLRQVAVATPGGFPCMNETLTESPLDLDRIRRALRAHSPWLMGPYAQRRAAVAAILRATDGEPELLLIERARRAGDPWSGQMGFPGGKLEPADASLEDAAIRETEEEVGLRLAGAEHLGQLGDQEGRHAGRPAGLIVSSFVYALEGEPRLDAGDEVAETIWVPLSVLLDPSRRVEHRHHLDPGRSYPGIRVSGSDRHVVWGLTYRFLQLFFGVLGERLPGNRA